MPCLEALPQSEVQSTVHKAAEEQVAAAAADSPIFIKSPVAVTAAGGSGNRVVGVTSSWRMHKSSSSSSSSAKGVGDMLLTCRAVSAKAQGPGVTQWVKFICCWTMVNANGGQGSQHSRFVNICASLSQSNASSAGHLAILLSCNMQPLSQDQPHGHRAAAVVY